MCETESRIRLKIDDTNAKEKDIQDFIKTFQKILFQSGRIKNISIKNNIQSKSLILLFKNPDDKKFVMDCIQAYSIYFQDPEVEKDISSVLKLFASKAKNSDTTVSQLIMDELIQTTIKESKQLDLQLSYTFLKKGHIGVISELLKQTTDSNLSSEFLISAVLFGPAGVVKVLAKHVTSLLGVPVLSLLV